MKFYAVALLACLSLPAMAAVDVVGTPSGEGNPNAVV